MLEFLTEQNLSVLTSKVCERVAFRRAVGDGAIVQEISKDKVAISEIEAFFEEITS